jgi:outer membrane receptor protein involved in Fe transport
MNKRMLALLFILLPGALIAQPTTGRISGVVRGRDGLAVEAATVLLHRQKDSVVVRTAVTNAAGGFAFSGVVFGGYFLSASSVGYAGVSSGGVEVAAATSEVAAPELVLVQVVKGLKEASVVSEKPFLQWKIDRLVVDVGASPFVTPGLSALDVLERSPGISIDPLTSLISLNSRAGAEIYINGRHSYLSGQDLLNYLRGLPAGSLDQIEIMSQPPAKYDAAGSAGVINILLKKNQADGVYGSVTGSGLYGFYFKTRDNLLVDWRKDKVNINFSYGVTDNKSFGDAHVLSSFRSGYGVPFSQYQDLTTSTVTTPVSHTPVLSVDYQASKRTNLGAGFTGLFTSSHSVTDGSVLLTDSLGRTVQHTDLAGGAESPVAHYGINLNLQQKLDTKGREISADADYLYYNSPASQYSDNYSWLADGSALAPYLVNGNIPSRVDIYAVKTDYEQPLKLGAGAKLEAGLKSSYVRTDNDAQYTQYDTTQGKWQPDAGLTNHFIYTENINAAYLTVSKQLSKKWSAEIGVRGEQTHSKGDERVQGSRFSRNYFQLFPDAYLKYTPNGKHDFNLSYGRRMDRPNYQDLNPFRFVLNQYSVREGNPGLQPEYVNNFEFSYNYKSDLTVWMDYFKFDNIFARVVKSEGQGEDWITVQTKENVAFRRNIFLFVFYHRALVRWWNVNWLTGLIMAKLSDPANTGDPVDQVTVFRLQLGNQFSLGRGWSMDLRGDYATRRLEGIRIYALPSGSIGAGFNKKVLKNKGTLTAFVNDIFDQFRPAQTSEAAGFFMKTVNHPETRYLTLTFNYRFGKQKQQRQWSEGAEDEQRRVNF